MFDLTMQTTIKRKSHQTCKHESILRVVMNVTSLSCSDRKKEVSGCSEQLHSVKSAFLKGSQGTAGIAGLPKKPKKVQNRKANCFALLKRITRLKCVNSEVRAVISHPKQGCLQWLHGTMPEPPWKTR